MFEPLPYISLPVRPRAYSVGWSIWTKRVSVGRSSSIQKSTEIRVAVDEAMSERTRVVVLS